MSAGTTAAPVAAGAEPGRRRVRHEVRDSIAVMAFSAVASSTIAVLLTLVVRLGN